MTFKTDGEKRKHFFIKEWHVINAKVLTDLENYLFEVFNVI